MPLYQPQLEQINLDTLFNKVKQLNDTIEAENFMKAREYIEAKRMVQYIHNVVSAGLLPDDLSTKVGDYATCAEDFINRRIALGKSLSELTVTSQKEIPAELIALAMKKIKIEAIFDDIQHSVSTLIHSRTSPSPQSLVSVN